MGVKVKVKEIQPAPPKTRMCSGCSRVLWAEGMLRSWLCLGCLHVLLCDKNSSKCAHDWVGTSSLHKNLTKASNSASNERLKIPHYHHPTPPTQILKWGSPSSRDAILTLSPCLSSQLQTFQPSGDLIAWLKFIDSSSWSLCGFDDIINWIHNGLHQTRVGASELGLQASFPLSAPWLNAG